MLAGDAILQSEVLEDLAQAANYRRWLCSLALPYLGENPLEIGSGNGDHAEEWRSAGRRLTVTEPEPARFALLSRRFAGDVQVAVEQLGLPTDLTATHSAVVAYNVLEHIEDDVAALASCGRLVRPGGAVVVLVPAFEFAMSRFDREIGHFRRYRVGSLRRAMEAAGLTVERLQYVNSLGLLAWWWGMRVCGLRPRDGRALATWDRFVIPLVRRLEAGRRPAFGQSVFAVARAAGPRQINPPGQAAGRPARGDGAAPAPGPAATAAGMSRRADPPG
jgi:SAM-dependent methyltransferase